MNSIRNWSKAFLLVTQDLDPNDLVGWLLVLIHHPTARKIGQFLQNEEDNSKNLGMPAKIEQLLRVFLAEKKVADIPRLAELTLKEALTAKIGAGVVVTTAVELSVGEKGSYLDSLTNSLAMPVVIDWQIEPNLIGGARFDLAGQPIDLSARLKLSNLRQVLTHN